MIKNAPYASGKSPREIAEMYGAYYEAPRDKDGKRIGPLTGYAARDSKDRNYVGDIYIDFAKIEQWPTSLEFDIANPLLDQLENTLGEIPSVFCGAPEGGKTLAALLSCRAGLRFIYPEKVVVEKAITTGSRDRTELRFARHEVTPGDKVVIVEDVCNNFSTTEQLIGEITKAGGQAIAIVCFLNRSPKHRKMFRSNGAEFPIISLWDEPMVEYEQDDPAVKDDIAAGNVVWKPKQEWNTLISIYQKEKVCA